MSPSSSSPSERRRPTAAVRLVLVVGCALLAGALFFRDVLGLFYLAACGLVPNMLILSRWFVARRGLAVGSHDDPRPGDDDVAVLPDLRIGSGV